MKTKSKQHSHLLHIMSGKLLTICHCEQSRSRERSVAGSNRKVLRLLRRARNDKYLTGHDMRSQKDRLLHEKSKDDGYTEGNTD